MPRITMSSPLTAAEKAEVDELADLSMVLRELLEASTKAEATFAQEASWFGIDEDAAGVEFESKGRKFRLTGFAPNSPKFPVLADILDGTGRTFKFTRDVAATINAAAAKRRTPV